MYRIIKIGMDVHSTNYTLCAMDVGLSMMCYRLREANKTCLGERQERGRMGKLL